MKRNIFIQLFAVFLLLLSLPSQAVTQTRFADSIKAVKKQLSSYKTDFESLNTAFETDENLEKNLSLYNDCCEKLQIYFDDRKSFITEYNTLYSIWSDIKQIRTDIDDKIETLEKAEERQNTLTKLNQDLEQIDKEYQDLIQRFQGLSQLKRNPASDTLDLLKNRDTELYTEYFSLKTRYKDLIEQEPSMNSKCTTIETSHRIISETPKIEKIKWSDIIFKISLLAAVLFFLINLIVSKKKLKDQMGGKKKKQIPTI